MRWVSEPMPVPTSSTTSCGVSWAASTSTSSRFRSIRKFCPYWVRGRRPTSSRRFLRKVTVCLRRGLVRHGVLKRMMIREEILWDDDAIASAQVRGDPKRSQRQHAVRHYSGHGYVLRINIRLLCRSVIPLASAIWRIARFAFRAFHETRHRTTLQHRTLTARRPACASSRCCRSALYSTSSMKVRINSTPRPQTRSRLAGSVGSGRQRGRSRGPRRGW